MNAVKCALSGINPERLLFATDYPFNFTGDPLRAAEYINNIKQLDLPPESVKLMLGGNAARVLDI